jgi:hypothetical protein
VRIAAWIARGDPLTMDGTVDKLVFAGLLCLATTVAVAGPPPAAGPSAPHRPGFMLYLSSAMGGGGGVMKPTFGLRVEQVHMSNNSGSPDAPDPMQHRELLNWAMHGQSDVRVEFGQRAAWSVTRGEFGGVRAMNRAAMAFGFHGTAARTANPSESRPFALTASSSPVSRDVYRESSTVREIAASAVATFKSAHLSPLLRHTPANERPTSMRSSYAAAN